MRYFRRAAAGLAVMAIALLAASWPQAAAKAGPYEIDAAVHATLDRFTFEVRGSRELLSHAYGVLVFPTIVKAGFGFGGEYGEGALLVRGRTAGYFNSVSGSFGFQLGAQARSVIILFMTPESLDAFSSKDGWKIGVDGSVTVIAVGAGGAIDSNTVRSPVVGFIFDQKGLMYNLTLEGSKISRIYR